MGLKKGTPGKGGRSRADSFSYTGVAHGLKSAFGAWMAGEPYWALAHEHTDVTPGTKPCLDWMTDGALRCPRCRPHTIPTWIGWVPLYREADHKSIMVIVHEGAMDLLAGLTYPTHVLVGRVDEKSSVFVKKSDNALSLNTSNDQRKRPVDITADLLTMWRMPDLERWLLDQRGQQQGVLLKSDGKPFDGMHAAAADRYADPAEVDGPSADAFDATVNRLKGNAARLNPSTNGKHKPK